MKILDDIYAVGGGIYGIGISHKLDSNVYLVNGGEEAALIDSGVGVNTERILQNVENEGLDTSKIKKLILTHAHLDHAGGAATLKDILGAEVYISEIEAPFLEKGDEESIGLTVAKKSGVYPNDFKFRSVKVDNRLRGDEMIRLGKYTMKIIHTPGHSNGSLCILLLGHEKRVLFTGDTIFMNGSISLLNLPDSSLTDYKKGINNLKDLSVDSLIPSHYGFTLSYGQYHIDLAADSLDSLSVPKMIL
jgi:hydroxyacylglutathione hydrolase